MSQIKRVVLDTSTLVSAALRMESAPNRAMSKALRDYEVCASPATLAELEQVLMREKFDRYLDQETRRAFLAMYRSHTHLFPVFEREEMALQQLCRDSRDNKFLALALSCKVEVLISSDNDLLILNPWYGIPVLSPVEFLARNEL